MGKVSASRDVHGGDWLEYRYAPELLPAGAPEPMTMWRYRALLPIDEGQVRYPLPVGGTPLVAAPVLRARCGVPGLWVKDETRGPSASNKDRATALVIEDGLRRGVDTITTASTGNAAVATAFGAAAAGLRAVVFISTDCHADKLALMLQAGALVFQVGQGYATAVDLSREAARHFGWLDRNTGTNPLTLEAKKTVALEIWEQLDRRAPDVVIVPVGDGPTLAAMHKGFRELLECGVIRRLPRLIGVQSTSCQPLVRAWTAEAVRPADLDPHGTVADGIAVTRPATGALVLDAVRESDGAMLAVTDQDLLAAVDALAAWAGVGAEPAGAASLAGLWAALERGLIDGSETVVVLATGRELKTAPAPTGGRGAAIVIEGRLHEVAERLRGTAYR
jgi:threonine synthase